MAKLKPLNYTPDQISVNAVYNKIFLWHKELVRRYEEELPLEEFELTKAALDAILKRAAACRLKGDFAIEDIARETNWFMLPWKASLWYSMNTIKKKPASDFSNTIRNDRIPKKKD